MTTHQCRLDSGEIGEVSTTLKPRELIGRYVMLSFEVEGEILRKYGTCVHVYIQEELDL